MKRFFSGLFAALVVVLSAAPFLYVFVRSFLSPGGVTFQYYYDVFLASPKYLFRFWKSIGMAVCIAAGQLLISVFAGFGFAKYKFPGRNFLFFLLMILMTLPVQVTLVPDFIMLGYRNLLNTYAALILPSIIVPLGTFILTQSFKSVPDTVLDAAMLDGCGDLRYLLTILLPLCRGTLTTLFVQSFLSLWNAYLWPLMVTASAPDMRTIMVGITKLNSWEDTNYELVLAGVTISLIPSFLLFALMRRNLNKDNTEGSLNG